MRTAGGEQIEEISSCTVDEGLFRYSSDWEVPLLKNSSQAKPERFALFPYVHGA
jgi:hypothetical protein